MLETAFIVLETPVTWLELIAFILALANIVCNVFEVHWGWPLTIVASVLYAWLFLASKLYGEAGVNLFFAATAFWGWWQWLRGRRQSTGELLRIERLDRQGKQLALIAWAVCWGLCTAILALATDSDVWWADGFVTAGSLVGTVLLGRKFIENWQVWLIVNAASIALFVFKGLTLTAVLYALFFGLAVWGWQDWGRRHAAAGEPRGAS